MSYGVRQPRNFSLEVMRELSRVGRAGYAFPPKPFGDIFFVHHFNGDDGNSGLSRDDPFKTIAHALSQCVNDHDDMIVVMEAWNIAEETWPIEVNKTRVHIIGMGRQWVALLPPGDTAVFNITALGNGGEIGGFSLGGGDSSPCINLVNPMDFWIHDCWFGNQFHMGGNAPLYGIGNTLPYNASNVRIERCRFFGSKGPGSGGITGDGIRNIAGAPGFVNSEIVNNRFTCLDYAIRLECATDFLVEHNYIMCPSDDVVGRGIHLTSCTGGIIANNKAGDNGIADMTNNPYYDQNAANNAWLCNQNGVTYVFPAQAL